MFWSASRYVFRSFCCQVNQHPIPNKIRTYAENTTTSNEESVFNRQILAGNRIPEVTGCFFMRRAAASPCCPSTVNYDLSTCHITGGIRSQEHHCTGNFPGVP